jgi:hypothetical protein
MTLLLVAGDGHAQGTTVGEASSGLFPWFCLLARNIPKLAD